MYVAVNELRLRGPVAGWALGTLAGMGVHASTKHSSAVRGRGVR